MWTVECGINLYPREVEEVLQRNPAVREAAVIGVRDEHWGEALVAYVAVRAGNEVSASELDAHRRAVLSSYKIPKEFRSIDARPRNAGGKVLKNELRLAN